EAEATKSIGDPDADSNHWRQFVGKRNQRSNAAAASAVETSQYSRNGRTTAGTSSPPYRRRMPRGWRAAQASRFPNKRSICARFLGSVPELTIAADVSRERRTVGEVVLPYFGDLGPQPAKFRLGEHSLVCFSHLRWDLVFQRPQHLMTRFARTMPVLVIEEPTFEGTEPPHFKSYSVADNLTIFVPHLMQGMPANTAISAQRLLTGKLLREARIETPVLWYYTPMALQFADAITAAVTVYDCMDELSAFQDAPPELRRLETDLLGRTDIVFTG